MLEALATLRAPDGKILIDGFYDDVRAPTPEDEAILAALPFEEDAEKARLGVDAFVGGDTGVDLLRRYFFEPTCNIAGIVSGFTIPGASKTVCPKRSWSRSTCAWSGQDHPTSWEVAPASRRARVRRHRDPWVSMEHPVRSPSDSLIGKAAIAAAREVFSKAPAISPMMIGTGPMYPIASTLGIPTVSPAGVCRPESNIHAPNENVRLEDFLRIVEYTVSWLEHFGKNAG